MEVSIDNVENVVLNEQSISTIPDESPVPII